MGDAKTVPTWLYHSTLPAKIFDLAPGEKMPKGWHDTPTAAEDELLKSEAKSKDGK